MGAKRVKPVEMGGTLWYMCGMCGNWSNTLQHITMCQKWFECVWNEENVDQMMGNGTYSIITINNTTKPFVCANCME